MIKHASIITLVSVIFLATILEADAQAVVTQPVAEVGKVDIIVEGNTYVPYFYAGRAEPSAGNSIRLIAIVPVGDERPTTYRWKVNNNYISTDDPVLQLKMPQVEERILVEVTALDSTNRPLGKGYEYVVVSIPRLIFYEDNALRGTAQVAIQDNIILIGEETAVKAEPYFAGVSAANMLNASWSSNVTLEQAEEDWRLIYIKSEEGKTNLNGQVNLKVSNPQNLNEYLSATFNVSL